MQKLKNIFTDLATTLKEGGQHRGILGKVLNNHGLIQSYRIDCRSHVSN